MTDADVCTHMLMGEPMVSLAALTELRSFLDSWLRDQTNTADADDHDKTQSRWEAPE